MSQKTPTNAFRSALRESVVILIAWIICCGWVVGYCAMFAYPSTGESGVSVPADTIAGIPSWVVWGIAVPWIAANLFTIAFCVFVLRDEDTTEGDDA